MERVLPVLEDARLRAHAVERRARRRNRGRNRRHRGLRAGLRRRGGARLGRRGRGARHRRDRRSRARFGRRGGRRLRRRGRAGRPEAGDAVRRADVIDRTAGAVGVVEPEAHALLPSFVPVRREPAPRVVVSVGLVERLVAHEPRRTFAGDAREADVVRVERFPRALVVRIHGHALATAAAVLGSVDADGPRRLVAEAVQSQLGVLDVARNPQVESRGAAILVRVAARPLAALDGEEVDQLAVELDAVEPAALVRADARDALADVLLRGREGGRRHEGRRVRDGRRERRRRRRRVRDGRFERRRRRGRRRGRVRHRRRVRRRRRRRGRGPHVEDVADLEQVGEVPAIRDDEVELVLADAHELRERMPHGLPGRRRDDAPAIGRVVEIAVGAERLRVAAVDGGVVQPAPNDEMVPAPAVVRARAVPRQRAPEVRHGHDRDVLEDALGLHLVREGRDGVVDLLEAHGQRVERAVVVEAADLDEEGRALVLQRVALCDDARDVLEAAAEARVREVRDHAVVALEDARDLLRVADRRPEEAREGVGEDRRALILQQQADLLLELVVVDEARKPVVRVEVDDLRVPGALERLLQAVEAVAHGVERVVADLRVREGAEDAAEHALGRHVVGDDGLCEALLHVVRADGRRRPLRAGAVLRERERLDQRPDVREEARVAVLVEAVDFLQRRVHAEGVARLVGAGSDRAVLAHLERHLRDGSTVVDVVARDGAVARRRQHRVAVRATVQEEKNDGLVLARRRVAVDLVVARADGLVRVRRVELGREREEALRELEPRVWAAEHGLVDGVEDDRAAVVAEAALGEEHVEVVDGVDERRVAPGHVAVVPLRLLLGREAPRARAVLARLRLPAEVVAREPGVRVRVGRVLVLVGLLRVPALAREARARFRDRAPVVALVDLARALFGAVRHRRRVREAAVRRPAVAIARAAAEATIAAAQAVPNERVQPVREADEARALHDLRLGRDEPAARDGALGRVVGQVVGEDARRLVDHLPDLPVHALELDLAAVQAVELHRAHEVEHLEQRLAEPAVRGVREQRRRRRLAVQQDRGERRGEVAVLPGSEAGVGSRAERVDDGGDVARRRVRRRKALQEQLGDEGRDVRVLEDAVDERLGLEARGLLRRASGEGHEVGRVAERVASRDLDRGDDVLEVGLVADGVVEHEDRVDVDAVAPRKGRDAVDLAVERVGRVVRRVSDGRADLELVERVRARRDGGEGRGLDGRRGAEARDTLAEAVRAAVVRVRRRERAFLPRHAEEAVRVDVEPPGRRGDFARRNRAELPAGFRAVRTVAPGAGFAVRVAAVVVVAEARVRVVLGRARVAVGRLRGPLLARLPESVHGDCAAVVALVGPGGAGRPVAAAAVGVDDVHRAAARDLHAERAGALPGQCRRAVPEGRARVGAEAVLVLPDRGFRVLEPREVDARGRRVLVDRRRAAAPVLDDGDALRRERRRGERLRERHGPGKLARAVRVRRAERRVERVRGVEDWSVIDGRPDVGEDGAGVRGRDVDAERHTVADVAAREIGLGERIAPRRDEVEVVDEVLVAEGLHSAAELGHIETRPRARAREDVVAVVRLVAGERAVVVHLAEADGEELEKLAREVLVGERVAALVLLGPQERQVDGHHRARGDVAEHVAQVAEGVLDEDVVVLQPDLDLLVRFPDAVDGDDVDVRERPGHALAELVLGV
mmetsp:Transcript_18404/g.59864  ORF Transcript_18404/g.59864 Transcript_18404/m.59864 type:complete len:1691 (-) Transcript_18404:2355-7427(-)